MVTKHLLLFTMCHSWDQNEKTCEIEKLILAVETGCRMVFGDWRHLYTNYIRRYFGGQKPEHDGSDLSI